MGRHLISSGSPFEAEIGYSRAVVQGDWVFVSGTTGFDYATMTIADDIAAQTAQCLANIAAALAQAGAGLKDIVRVHYIVPKADEFPACWPVLRQHLGEVRPAATMISAALLDPRMRIEIEVTALKSRADAAPTRPPAAPARVPPGFGTVTPYFFVQGAARFLAFLVDGLGGEEIDRHMNGDRIANAQVRLGTSTVMVSEASAAWPAMPASYYLYVDDADAAMARAIAAGAEKVMDVADKPYQDRQGGVRDPFGNLWWLSQRLVDGPYD
jgi:PhnB protein